MDNIIKNKTKLIFLVFFSVLVITLTFVFYKITESKNVNDYNSIAAKTKEGYLVATRMKASERLDEVVNNVENGGDPIQLVINVGTLYAPIYAKLDQTTKVRVITEEPLIIYLKNKDLLSAQTASNLNQPQMVITATPSSWKVFGKNPMIEPNSIDCGISLKNLADRTGVIKIEKIYDKGNKQILLKPITFKLELSDDIK